MVKQVALCVAVTLALAAVAFATVTLGLAGLGTACAGATLGLVHAREALFRDRAVRRLVATAYRAGAGQVGLAHLSRVLPTPDVVQARSEALRAEAEMLAQRYANGDASDY